MHRRLKKAPAGRFTASEGPLLPLGIPGNTPEAGETPADLSPGALELTAGYGTMSLGCGARPDPIPATETKNRGRKT